MQTLQDETLNQPVVSKLSIESTPNYSSVTNVGKPRRWINLVIPTFIVFLALIGLALYIAHINNQAFSGTYLIGSIIMGLVISACFFLVSLIISSVGRKFGIMYSVIIWTLLIAAAMYSIIIFYSPFGHSTLFPSQQLSQNTPKEDSVALPPGTDLSQFPSYIQIDKSRIVNLPGGGMVIPKSAIKFAMTYDDCLKTTDLTAEKACANKYSLEMKNLSLCKSLIHSDSQNTTETILDSQEECIAQYAAVNMQASLCDTITNKYIADINCFGNIVNQIKDQNQCSVVFKKDTDIKDCVRGVAQNQQNKP